MTASQPNHLPTPPRHLTPPPPLILAPKLCIPRIFQIHPIPLTQHHQFPEFAHFSRLSFTQLGSHNPKLKATPLGLVGCTPTVAFCQITPISRRSTPWPCSAHSTLDPYLAVSIASTSSPDPGPPASLQPFLAKWLPAPRLRRRPCPAPLHLPTFLQPSIQPGIPSTTSKRPVHGWPFLLLDKTRRASLVMSTRCWWSAPSCTITASRPPSHTYLCKIHANVAPGTSSLGGY